MRTKSLITLTNIVKQYIVYIKTVKKHNNCIVIKIQYKIQYKYLYIFLIFSSLNLMIWIN